jgi:uncharacterized membrane protein SpoIIM required for sporulation
VIVDLPRFIAAEQKYWDELSAFLRRAEDNPRYKLSLDEINRVQYVYQRTSSALARLGSFSGEIQVRQYLEDLVARSYAEFQPSSPRFSRVRALNWFFVQFPQAFRRRFAAFALALALTVGGTAFGACALLLDRDAKTVLMPFSELNEDPATRVKREEAQKGDRMAGHKGSFAAMLMTHNIQVALFTFALGVTWGVGSILLIFYNGVTLGAVAIDYIRAGQTQFLLGWLLPHGVIEIPAILVAGQAAFVLASALIGWNNRERRGERLRACSKDLLTLAGAAAVMLVWAGVVESFFSQYHYPVLPYGLKIGFGLIEFAALCVFLARAGRRRADG